MAERRMFSKKIIDTDAFLDMPLSAQALYFHLAMRADDEGFVGNAKTIQRTVRASDDDMRLLIVKRFVLAFPSGVQVIKHWRIHNYINPDRFTPTTYIEEKSTLAFDAKKAYVELAETPPFQDDTQNVLQIGDKMATQGRLGESSADEGSLGKDKSGNAAPATRARFVKPTVEEIAAYCVERNNGIDAQHFYDYYESNGWCVGKHPMKDWKATIRNWEHRDKQAGRTAGNKPAQGKPKGEKYKRED